MAIAAEIYADNDADILIEDLPAGLSVEWGIVPLGAGGTPPGPSVSLTAIDADVSGAATENAGPPVTYTDVLEGAAITAHLLPTYQDQQVALVVRVGQDVRVYGITTVRAARLAT